MIGVGVAWCLCQPQVGATLEQNGQSDGHFKPRERGTDAKMQAGPEAGMCFGRPVGVEAIRIGPDRGVAIGGGKEEGHLIAPFEIMPEQGDIFVGKAREHVERRIVAQDFLDGGVDPFWSEAGAVRAGFQQRFDPIAKAVNGRLVTGVEEQNAGPDQFIRAELFAVFLGGDQLRDQIVARILAALVDIPAQESGEFGGGLVGCIFDRPA